MEVAVYNLPELGFRLTRKFADLTDSLVATWYSLVSSIPNHAFASVFLFLLRCEDKVSVSSSLQSDFSLWQGDSGFVMRGV